MGGTARGRQSVGDRKLTHSGPPARIGRRAGSELPEEGLEPTRTYAQALLRRPRLPFRHSGRRKQSSQTLVWHVPRHSRGATAPSNARMVPPPGRVYPSTLRWELIGNVSVSRQESQRSRPGEPGPPGRSGGLYPVDRAISGPALQHGVADGWWPRRRRRHRAGGLSARLGKDSDPARRALQVVAIPDRRESLL